MFCIPTKSKKRETEAKWIIYNQGTDLQFAECSECGFEDGDQVFQNLMMTGDRNSIICRCPKCGAKMIGWLLAEEL